jgi:hypothetical protein
MRFSMPMIFAAVVVALTLAGCESPDASAQPSSHSTHSDTQTGTPPEPTVSPLDEHAWDHRPVILFAPAADDPTYRRQTALFDDHRAGIEDRDIVIYSVFDGSGSGPDGQLEPVERRALRSRFSPDSEFTVILVGKDTTEKLRQSDILEIDTLFSTIDAMPMRQREMKQHKDSSGSD